MKRVVVLAVVATSGLVACGGGDDDVSPAQLRAALVEQGIDARLADCIVAGLEADLSSSDFDEIARADENLDGLSPELQTFLTETVTDCALAG